MHLHTQHDIPDFIRAIADKIAREYQPEKIILFGSYAWGEPGPDSDVDLFIVKETSVRAIDRIVEVRRFIQRERHRIPMDILVITQGELAKREQIGDLFCHQIMHDGALLYAA